jgi:hypothetical protein
LETEENVIRSDAKVLHSFNLADFSGGVNTDAEASLKELLQCKNFIIDSKGRPVTRGGSSVINPTSPIGKQDIEVWGYLFGYAAEAPVYEADAALGRTMSASSADGSHLASAANDADHATYWLMEADKFRSITPTVFSGSNPANMTDGDASTYWEAVI